VDYIFIGEIGYRRRDAIDSNASKAKKTVSSPKCVLQLDVRVGRRASGTLSSRLRDAVSCTAVMAILNSGMPNPLRDCYRALRCAITLEQILL